MKTLITIRRLTIATVLKIMILGAVLSVVPCFILMGVLGFFGTSSGLIWNNQPLTGLPALLAAPFMGLFFAVFLGLFMGISTFVGLWLYSLFRPIEIAYLSAATMSSTGNAV